MLPILEDPFDIAPHKQPMKQGATLRAIADLVQANRAPVALLESVRVAPKSAGTTQLHIQK
jgi:hypothetical protein